jgi:hypothetical protein
VVTSRAGRILLAVLALLVAFSLVLTVLPPPV